MNSQEIIKQFEQSRVGHVLNGKESFRNKMGRVVHGLCYKHRVLMILTGIGAMAAGVGMGAVGAVALSPVMFGGVYGGLSPKKNEKAACEALMNIAVRKGAALARFMSREGVSESLKKQTLQKYLNDNMPLGCQKEYQQAFPYAIADILNRDESKAQYHNPDVYLLEAVQEEFTKSNEKGGVLHGMAQVFTKKYYQQEAKAKKVAMMRWQDRQQWEKMGSNRPKWPEFMKALVYQRKTNHSSLRLLWRSKNNLPELTQTKSVNIDQTKSKVKCITNKNAINGNVFLNGSSHSF